MCGVVGALMFGDLKAKDEKARQESVIFLVSELLRLTEKRGEDATGVSALFKDGNYIVQKMGVKSSEFLARYGGTTEDYEGFLKVWRESGVPVKMFMGHCRKTSVGGSYDNANNHPVRVGDMIVVHNGTLTNHNKIIANLGGKRDGTVDTEAIVRLLHKYTDNGKKPVTLDMIEETANRLQGTYACLAYNGNNPYQMAVFRDGRPIEFAFIPELKTVLIASEHLFLKQAFLKYNDMKHLYGRTDFVHLGADNTELRMMPDDSIVIFDLTRPIDEKTKLADLFEDRKTARVNKTWDNTSTTTTTSSTTSGVGTTVTAKPATSQAARSEASGPNSKTGMVWNKDLRKHVPAATVQADSGKGTVEVNTDTGEVIDVDYDGDGDEVDTVIPTSKPKVALKEVDKPAVVKGQAASIIQLPAGSDKGGTNATKKEAVKPVKKATEVKIETDADAIEAAAEAAKKMDKFETVDDVMHEIEVADTKTVSCMPLHALANRIKAFIYRAAYYDGYVAGKKSRKVDAVGAGSGEKLNRAQNSIRILKHVVRVFSRVADNLALDRSSGSTYNRKSAAIEEATRRYRAVEKVGLKDLQTVFTEGDLRDATISRVVTELDCGEE